MKKLFVFAFLFHFLSITAYAANGFFLGQNYFPIGISETKALSLSGNNIKIEKASLNQLIVMERDIKGEWDIKGYLHINEGKVTKVSRSWGNFHGDATQLFTQLHDLLKDIKKDQELINSIEIFEGSNPDMKQVNIRLKFKSRTVSIGLVDGKSIDKTVYIDDSITKD